MQPLYYDGLEIAEKLRFTDPNIAEGIIPIEN
jgi:hypothetical protein